MKVAFRRLGLAVLPALLLLSTGCGGLSGSYGVSPLSLFLLGPVQVQPNPDPTTLQLPDQDSDNILAQAN